MEFRLALRLELGQLQLLVHARMFAHLLVLFYVRRVVIVAVVEDLGINLGVAYHVERVLRVELVVTDRCNLEKWLHVTPVPHR